MTKGLRGGRRRQRYHAAAPVGGVSRSTARPCATGPTHEYDHPDLHGSDTPDAVLVDANGDVYLVGNTEIAQNQSEGIVRKLDPDGVELWTQPVPGVIFTHGALDPDGNLLLTGYDDDDDIDLWIGKYDPDFAPLGTTEHDGPSGGVDLGLAVAAGPSANVYVTGLITVIGEQSNLWAGRYASDLGLRWWSDAYGNQDALLADEGRAVAVSADESRVAVAGLESAIGQDTNIWLRVCQNNPAPQQ